MNISDSKEIKQEEIELLLLTNSIENKVGKLPASVQTILNGQYEDIFNNEMCLNIMQALDDTNNFSKLIINKIENEGMYDFWLYTSIASLLHFIQCNWTGPKVEESIEWLNDKEDIALKELSLHDECNINVKMPQLLYLSKIVFSSHILQNSYKSCVWWLFRANLIHQYVLNESSGIIYDEIEHLISKINHLELWNENMYCETLFYLEVAQFYFYYRRVQISEKYVELAQGKAKLNLDLEGALGKRTKHQVKDKAQLLLKIKLGKERFPTRYSENLPKSVDLNDDIRLERIKFLENVEHTQLGAMEEAIVLAKYIQLQLSQPKDKLTDEEVKAYLTVVIDNTRNWSLKMASLYYRCSLESSDKRAIERSMMQIEYLIHELKNTHVPVRYRIDLFFVSSFKPFWSLEELWARLMLNFGLVKSALNAFLKINLWEEVIMCYNILELKHKAAEIIHQELARKPTVQLWCLLGDATQDPSCYETAWKLSNEKSSRVQKHWGFYHFEKNNFEEAILHLNLSVELNNIQENVWLRLGFAALQTENWKLAVFAYKRYCALEPMTFEAWNNLAKAYIKLGDKSKAWKSLQDAIKCNYDRWQIWDNLMVVSTDLGHFSEVRLYSINDKTQVIRCYHRILDLKNHHLDIQVLDILTNAILNNIHDSDGNPAHNLLPKVLELFGRVTCSIPNDSNIWRMYGQLTALKKTDADNDKAIKYLQQAHRIAVLDVKWLKQECSVEKVLHLCCILAKIYLDSSANSELKKKQTLLASAKLCLQGVVKKVKEQDWRNENIIAYLAKIEEYLSTVINELEQIKTAS